MGHLLRVSHRHRYQLPGSNKSSTRTGKEGAEFLLKNQLLRCLHPAGDLAHALIQDAVPLKHGKSCAAQFTVCARDWKSLRQMGHVGCAVEHFCWDRQGITMHERLWRQWYARSEALWDHLAGDVPKCAS